MYLVIEIVLSTPTQMPFCETCSSSVRDRESVPPPLSIFRISEDLVGQLTESSLKSSNSLLNLTMQKLYLFSTVGQLTFISAPITRSASVIIPAISISAFVLGACSDSLYFPSDHLNLAFPIVLRSSSIFSLISF